jgi:uncharacterized protein YegL
VWQERSYDYDAQFTNWETKTCTRFDKDENNQFLAEPKTGRISSCKKATECREDASDECAKYPYFEPGTSKQDGSEECRCNYQTVFEDDGEWIEHNEIESKPDYLTKTGCTDSGDDGLCSVSKSKFGISLPQGTSVNDRRVSSEICGTNTLINDFQDNADANPDTNWHYMGFQKSGMYRIWPSVYECRTEAQCSGCSDPRYRTWYANAASGPKDVVLVLDDSGSMKTNNRIGKMKEAAKWVISTLGPNDYVSIVKFTNSAESATENLIPATLEGRAELKNYIDTNFNANGGTNMGDGLEKAFDIISDSRVARQSAFCEKIILFLTDGAPTKGDRKCVDVRNLAALAGVRIHTLFVQTEDADAYPSVLDSLAADTFGSRMQARVLDQQRGHIDLTVLSDEGESRRSDGRFGRGWQQKAREVHAQDHFF